MICVLQSAATISVHNMLCHENLIEWEKYCDVFSTTHTSWLYNKKPNVWRQMTTTARECDEHSFVIKLYILHACQFYTSIKNKYKTKGATIFDIIAFAALTYRSVNFSVPRTVRVSCDELCVCWKCKKKLLWKWN